MIVTEDAIRNTDRTLIFKDNLQPAPMAEEIQSAQRAEKPIMGLTGRIKIEN